jgi:hypothetical protein
MRRLLSRIDLRGGRPSASPRRTAALRDVTLERGWAPEALTERATSTIKPA